MTYTPARPLLAHQATELARMQGQEAWALLMEFGTGKSAVIVADAGRLYTAGRINGVLVLAPKGSYRDWSLENDETSHWHLNMRQDLHKFVVRWKGGHNKYERIALDMLIKMDSLSVLVVNTEALSNGNRAYDECVKFLTARTCMLVVDESTQVKSPGAKRTKKVIKLAGMAKYQRILTGFPTPKSSMDLYSQFQVLDWKILGHKSFWTFKYRYALTQPLNLGSRTIEQIVGYKNTEELWGKIAPYSSRVRADDCLDLPPIQYVKRVVEMPDETRRVYRELCQQATSELDGGGHVTATLAITLIMRLHQIACGHVTTETGELTPLPCGKYDELLELIEEIGETEKIVIWTHWRHSIQTIVADLLSRFGMKSTVSYWGDVSETHRAENLHRFAHDPECRFFVGSQMAGGRGINDLVVARHAVFFSNPPDLELRLNAEARTRRKGSEGHSSIVYHDLTTADTVEEKIVKSLRARLDLASLIVGDKIREWLV